jgi:hypothetical protein
MTALAPADSVSPEPPVVRRGRSRSPISDRRGSVGGMFGGDRESIGCCSVRAVDDPKPEQLARAFIGLFAWAKSFESEEGDSGLVLSAVPFWSRSRRCSW